MTTRAFIQSAALTAIAVNFLTPEVHFVADHILPRVDVGDETYKYDVYNTAEAFTVPDTTVGRRGMVPEVEFSAEQKAGFVVDRGLDSPVPQSDIDRAARQRAAGQTGYDPEARAVEGLVHLMRIDRERRVAALVDNINTYDADKRVTLAGSDKWTHADSTPIDDISAGQDATLIARPNIAVCSRPVATALRKNKQIVKAVHGNDGDAGYAPLAKIAELLELEAIYVGDSFINASRPGQAASMERIWGSGFSLLHRSSVASNTNGIPTFGMTAEMRYNGSPVISGRFTNPKGPGLLGGTTVRVGESVQEHILAPSVGYHIAATI